MSTHALRTRRIGKGLNSVRFCPCFVYMCLAHVNACMRAASPWAPTSARPSGVAEGVPSAGRMFEAWMAARIDCFMREAGCCGGCAGVMSAEDAMGGRRVITPFLEITMVSVPAYTQRQCMIDDEEHAKRGSSKQYESWDQVGK